MLDFIEQVVVDVENDKVTFGYLYAMYFAADS
jgi:hypothetical protein